MTKLEDNQRILNTLTPPPDLPSKNMANQCLRCHEHTLWPKSHRTLNNLSKNPTAFKDADGYICPLCGQEEDARHIRRVIKDMTLEEGR